MRHVVGVQAECTAGDCTKFKTFGLFHSGVDQDSESAGLGIRTAGPLCCSKDLQVDMDLHGIRDIACPIRFEISAGKLNHVQLGRQFQLKVNNARRVVVPRAGVVSS